MDGESWAVYSGAILIALFKVREDAEAYCSCREGAVVEHINYSLTIRASAVWRLIFEEWRRLGCLFGPCNV